MKEKMEGREWRKTEKLTVAIYGVVAYNNTDSNKKR